MKKSKKAESLVSVMVVVVILAFTALGIFSILSFDKEISGKFSENIDLTLIKSNTENLTKKLALKDIGDGEEFFLYKNTASGTYEIFTGSTNEKYKFIDNLGNLKEGEEILGKYERSFVKKADIVANSENIEVKVK